MRATGMIDLTALVLTFNEKENISRSLDALGWVSKILIIDSFSTDETAELARSFHPNVNVVQRRFDSHAGQWNFGVDQVTTPWVLSLDADYIVTPELVAEISDLTSADDVAGYNVRFHYCLGSKRLRASLYPPRIVLFRKDKGRYVNDGHTQLWKSTGPVLTLSGYIEHDDRKPLSRWVNSQLKYSKIEAQHLLVTPKTELSAQDRLRLKIFYAPTVVFVYLLFARVLIFDGWRGWYYVFQRTVAEMLLSLRLLIEKHRIEEPETSENRDQRSDDSPHRGSEA